VLDGEPVFGVSVFVALDDVRPVSERGVLSGKLRTYPSIYRSTVGELVATNLGLLPTFAPPLYTVPLPELDRVDDRPPRWARFVQTPTPIAESRNE